MRYRAKIAVITGSRAEYGLLHGVMQGILAAEEFELQIVATGMHLSPEFGLTFQAIEADGFEITEKVEMLVSSDTPIGVTKSIGLGLIGFADAFRRLKPDYVIVLGDRYEMMAAALAAFMARIPIAHIGGGDITEGAYDDSIRHSMTKMSQLHFVTNEISLHRVRQLGENPASIFNVGHPGLDRIRELKLLTRSELERELDFTCRSRNLLVTYHPETLGNQEASVEFAEVLNALHRLGPETGILFTKPNADEGGRKLGAMIDDFVDHHANSRTYTSLGQLRYFSAVQAVDAVIGNSSSGICEVPSLRKPTVDIGDRQKGRLRGSSVLHAEAKSESIWKAVHQAYQLDCSKVDSAYGDGTSSVQILEHLKQHIGEGRSQPKVFFEAYMQPKEMPENRG
ncbi:UDP-N-acetylglucosamine 2-epimerase (non-hydrolysing) [Paenibacillus sp. 1_12]|uniref:UDP-N-acetylglucosamine 2-epimerase n=1 Tax=Paenibacillus sp. 1_12 TaxID=1566278 RepID=UPI0008F39E39|nr:UDP-N-acetylglucosamine 2-epimerase [Paenibacillus sp. 1_12]SFK81459.1 UDP-N-acetylglucosamine 2-epimerase (non-hydrolysing) [Paenibacillus sp. 1_12]